MKSFLPLQLQTAIKVSLATTIAWVISNFLGFPASFIAPLLASMTTFSGLALSWFLLTRGSIMMAISFATGGLFSIWWGNNYISIFVLILLMGAVWNYLQLHGFIGSFLILITKLAFIVIHGNNSDPVTMAFYEYSNYFIGVAVATIFNRLFWVNTTQESLTEKLRDFSQNSCELIDIIFTGYIENNLDKSLAKNLHIKINQGIESSEKTLKLSTFDPTNKGVSKDYWQEIINRQKNVYFHLSALLLLVESSEKINLSSAIISKLKDLSNSLQSILPRRINYLINENNIDLDYINSNLYDLNNILNDDRKNEIIKNQKLSEIITFYSVVKRLEKLTKEINQWDSNSVDNLLLNNRVLTSAQV